MISGHFQKEEKSTLQQSGLSSPFAIFVVLWGESERGANMCGGLCVRGTSDYERTKLLNRALNEFYFPF